MVDVLTRAVLTPPLYPCDICGREWTAEQMVYSRHREVRYCPVAEWKDCVRPDEEERAA